MSSAGSLTITISAPPGTAPAVTVSGPGGFSRALSSTATLSGLVTGSYSVTAASVTSSDVFVSTVTAGTVAGSPAAVAAGDTASVTVTYAVRPGTGGLWVVTSARGKVVQYRTSQFGGTTVDTPATTIITSQSSINSAIAFDAAGNMWLADLDANEVVEFSASQLASNATRTPQITLTVAANALQNPGGLVFDSLGNLWVSYTGSSAIAEFSTSQLASGGSVSPVVVLSASLESLNEPQGIAFDAAGNLWVANFSNVVKFASGDLQASGNPTPSVSVSGFSELDGIAFDSVRRSVGAGCRVQHD